MDRLDAMTAFVAAVDEGSLAAAARRLGHSPANVTRAITSLEDWLGAQLLRRTTRALHLTEFGESYLDTCRKVLAELNAAKLGAAAERDAPRGLLTLTAPVLFGQLRVRPLLHDYLQAYPDVQARLVALDRIVNLIEEGIDVAVRLAHLPDSNLVAVRLGQVRQVVCASPSYLARHKNPKVPADLLQHACLMANSTAGVEPWSFAPGPGSKRKALQPVAVRPRIFLTGSASAIDSAVEGHGIARVLSYQVEEHLKAGRLKLLLTGFEPSPIPVHLVFSSANQATAKLRSFIDFATPRLRAQLAGGGE
jgi:DNA-binding transcriptional LysR family regulator